MRKSKERKKRRNERKQKISDKRLVVQGTVMTFCSTRWQMTFGPRRF